MSDQNENTMRVKMPHCHVPGILKGQKAIVTGASSGIGKAVARSLGEAGADVVVNYVSDDDPVEEILDSIRELGVEAHGYKADVSDEEQVREMFKWSIEKMGTVDILVNNAGIQVDAPFHEMTLDQWNSVLGVNLTGQFLCSREAVREFRRRGVVEEISCAAGKIICMSSVHDRIPWARRVNYATSKGGVTMMMKSIAQEVAEHRIRVNSICPGAIKTDMNKDAWETPEAKEDLKRLIPYNRVGETGDIGRVAAWLASDQADYIVGANLYVDGGMMLYPGFAAGG